ncbi:MAG TPA: TonB-dependent receptor [Bryobacteraceae bacterium]|nr:TonB-dependent receptor [Bryobacteraceae bacterium]
MKTLRTTLVVLVCAAALFAQADRGSIVGTITDPTGAVVPNATVSIVNTATNVTFNSVTSNSGTYAFLNLPVGTYTLHVKAAGFRSQDLTGIGVQVNQQSKVDVGLQVGDVGQTVEVAAQASLIQPDSTDVGTVLNEKRFLDLPLTLGGGIRDPSAFIFLSPGVSGNTWEKHIGGGGSFNDQIYFDGIALSRGDLANDAEVNPSVDAIAEFKLILNNYSAEYSHALSGVTSYTMKSGTNQFHGDMFEFNDNNHFDARGFFSPTKAYRNQNEWGITAGAPVMLPKIYNGANKTFWFFSFDQFYIRGGQLTGLNTLATAPMLKGDFSQWPGPIYDPRTTSVDASGKVTRTPFPNNVIPTSAFSSVTSKMLPYIPAPTLSGLVNNSPAPLAGPWSDQRTAGFKIDQVIRTNHHLSGMFNMTDRPAEKSPGPSRLLPVGTSTGIANYNIQRVTTRLIRVNYDWNISPTLLNHMGAGFSRFRNPNFSVSYNQGWEQPNGGKLGLNGTQFDLFPTVLFSQGYTRFGDDIASDNYFTTLAFLDNLTWIKGRHTVKFGFEIQGHRDNYRNFGSGGGDFSFSQLETGLPGMANAGNAFASFLLGAVDSGYSYFRSSLPGGRYRYYGLFVDDSFKVTPTFMLDMGLRWEVQVPTSDPLGRISYMDPSVANPAAGNLLGAYVFGGNGQGRGGFNRFFDIHYKDFAPRIGFAWTFAKNTVLRGGYGIFYKEYINEGVGIPQTGFSITPTFATADNGITPAFYWDNGFPQNFSMPPLISPTVANGQGAQEVQRATGGTIPYSQQYNITLEHQFSDTLLLSAAYVGNKTTHMYDQLQLNQVSPAYYGLGDALLRSNINSPAAQAAGIQQPFPGFAQLYGARATVAQALRAYPQYQGVGVVAAPYANSTYNSLQVKMDKRFSHGLTGTFAYTRSKYLSDGVGFTSGNGGVTQQNYFKREKFLYPTDQPNIIVFSFNYELPVGRGKAVPLRGFLDKAFGGWALAGVASYGSGFPIPIYTTNTLPIFNGGLRPNLTGQPLMANWTGDPNAGPYLNKAAFSQPGPLQFGNAPVYLPVRQPWLISESFGAIKDTVIFERITTQFRLEMANPFNRVVFGAPTADFSSPSFGLVSSTSNSPRQIQFGMKLIW